MPARYDLTVASTTLAIAPPEQDEAAWCLASGGCKEVDHLGSSASISKGEVNVDNQHD